MAKRIQTITGPVDIDALGLILPHEHLFTDLRGPLIPGYAQAEPDAVVHVVEPFLVDAATSGVTALVECSTVGGGAESRNLAQIGRNFAYTYYRTDRGVSRGFHSIIPA
jgi:predicted metal-dependent phosphotriesterase family hydrolase